MSSLIKNPEDASALHQAQWFGNNMIEWLERTNYRAFVTNIEHVLWASFLHVVQVIPQLQRRSGEIRLKSKRRRLQISDHESRFNLIFLNQQSAPWSWRPI